MSENRAVPQESMFAIGPVVLDHIKRKVQDPIFRTIPKFLDMGDFLAFVRHLTSSMRRRLSDSAGDCVKYSLSRLLGVRNSHHRHMH